MKPEQGWCIKDSNDGELFINTTNTSRQDCINDAAAVLNATWPEMGRRGFTCVKVTVSEVEDG